jgi:hypothetical protein
MKVNINEHYKEKEKKLLKHFNTIFSRKGEEKQGLLIKDIKKLKKSKKYLEKKIDKSLDKKEQEKKKSKKRVVTMLDDYQFN